MGFDAPGRIRRRHRGSRSAGRRAATPDRGVAALVDGEQVAIFLLSPLDDGPDAALYAIGTTTR